MRGVVLAAAFVACAAPAARAPILANPGGGVAGASLDPARREHLLAIMPAVSAYLDAQVREHGFPAMVVGVVAGGELAWSQSFGPVRDDSVFRIGSITKPFTAMAVLKLRDEGKLSLDDPVEAWLPELASLRYPTADSPRITIRHLLTHTSGIGMNTRVDYWSRPRALTEKELYAHLDGFELVHAPGTQTIYSNVGMGLAGLVVQRASGQRYRDYMDAHILAPLGMTSSYWDREQVPEARLAVGSRRVGDMRVTEHEWQLGAIEGMGGLYASLRDMARFATWQLAAWPPRDDPDPGPVARASVREAQMLGGHTVPGRRSYGFGWQVRTDPDVGHVASHVGGTFQYAAAVWLLTERDLGVIVMTNDGHGLDKVDGIARTVAVVVALHEHR